MGSSHNRAPAVARVSLGAADKVSPEKATKTPHVDVDKIPVRKAVRPSIAPVKIPSLREEKRNPGHIPSLPNHASALAKKTKSVTSRPKDLDKLQPALKNLFKEDGEDPMTPSPQEMESGYLQPEQPPGMPGMPPGMPPGMQGSPQGMRMPPQGMGMPMGKAPGGPPIGPPAKPGMKQMVKGKTTGNSLSEMI